MTAGPAADDADRAGRPRRGSGFGWGYCLLPAVVFSVLTFVLPIGIFLANSVFEFVSPAQPSAGPTLHNYAAILGDVYYLRAFGATLKAAAIVVAGTLVLGYPLAYVLARSRSRWRQALAMLVVISLFVSVVIRAIGWKLILGPNGPVNHLLLASGIFSQPLRLSDNFTGSVIGLMHAELPFMVMMLVPVIQLVPRSLEDAALSLGTPWWRVFWRVLFPLTMPGVISGCLLVGSLAVGAYTTPALLSGGRVPFVPLLIAEQILQLLRYPQGAALATILVVVVVCINGLVFRALRTRVYGAAP